MAAARWTDSRTGARSSDTGRTLTIALALLASVGCMPESTAIDTGVGRDARTDAADAPREIAALDATSVDSPAVDVSIQVDARPPGFARLGAIRRDGPTATLRTHMTVNYRGVDSAYDPVARVFLVVYGNGPIGGAFLDDDGVQIGDGFRLTEQPYDGSNWTQLPRVAFGNGSFLVTWHLEQDRAVVVQTRRVRYGATGPVFDAPPVVIAPGGSQQESAASLAYAPAIDEYLVTWQQRGIKASRTGPDGIARGEVIVVSEDGTWGEQPSVVYAPAARCYFVAYMQEIPGGARVGLARIDAATGRLLAASRDITGTVTFAKVTDLAFDQAAGEVIATWYEVRSGVAGFAAQRFGEDGEPVAPARPVFAPHGSYDGYDVAWSPVTGTSLGVFHGPTVEAFGAELDVALSNATPIAITESGARNGLFLPRTIAHPMRPFWLVFGSPDYARVTVQRIARAPAM